MTDDEGTPDPNALRALAHPGRWQLGGPLAMRDFQRLSAGQFASTIGDYCYAIALPWYVLSSHGSTILLGIVLACYGVPRTALIPVGGVLADRMSPRAVMLMADSGRCVLVGVLVLLATRHSVSLTYLGPTAALIGAGEGLFIPASFAILPSVLETSQLTAGNGLFSAFQQGGSFVGPAIGGVVVAVASPAPAFRIDAASFAISALTLAFSRGRVRDASPTETAPSADSEPPAASGGILRLLRTSPVLQFILVIIIAANLTSAGLGEIALPALAHQRWAASGYGALLCCIAAGSIVGSLVGARSGGLRRPAVVASLLFAGESVAVGIAPFLGGLPGMAAALVLMGLGNGLGNTIMLPRMQAWAPPELIGRVMGLVMLCAFGTAPVSVAITGVLVHHFGAVAFFPVAGCVVGVVVLAALASKQWRNFGALPSPEQSSEPTSAASIS